MVAFFSDQSVEILGEGICPSKVRGKTWSPLVVGRSNRVLTAIDIKSLN